MAERPKKQDARDLLQVERRANVKEIVHEAILGESWLQTARAVQLAVRLKTIKGSKKGQEILEGLDNEFKYNEITFKYAAPANLDDQKAREELSQIYEEVMGIIEESTFNDKKETITLPSCLDFIISKMIPVVLDEPGKIASEVISVTRLQKIPPSNLRLTNNIAVLRPLEQTSQNPVEQEVDFRDALVHELAEINNNRTEADNLQSIDQLLTKVISRQTKTSFISTFVDKKFGTVSFRDLLDEPDAMKLGEKTIEYLSNAPKGDLVTNLWIRNMIHFYLSNLNRTDIGTLKNKNWMRQAVIIDQLFATKLIGPAFNPHEVDRDFDHKFKRILNSFPDSFHYDLTISIYEALANTQEVNRELGIDSLMSEIAQQYNLTTVSILEQNANDEYHQYLKSDPENYIVHNPLHKLLVTHRQDIIRSIRLRFGDQPGATNIINQLRNIISPDVDIAQMYKEQFLSVVKESLGENFFENLQKRAPQLIEATKRVWKDVVEKTDPNLSRAQDRAFWPFPMVKHTIPFEENTLPALTGLKEIQFITTDENHSIVHFQIMTIKKSVDVYGMCAPNGEMIEISVDFSSDIPGLQAVIDHVVATSFHNLISRIRVERKQSHRRTQVDTTQPTTATRPPHNRPRDLPRRTYSRGELLDVYGPNEETIRLVDSHKMDLYGRKELLAALDFHRELGDDETVFELINTALEKMRHISQKKVDAIPPSFALEYRIVPIKQPDGTIRETKVFLETWRIAYTKPKSLRGQIVEQKIKYPELFERHYRNGSALAMMEELKGWIFDDANNLS